MIIEKVVGNFKKYSVVFVREMEEIANNDTPIDMNKKYRMSGRIIVWETLRKKKKTWMSNYVKDIGANRFIKFDRKEGEQKVLHPVELYIYVWK